MPLEAAALQRHSSCGGHRRRRRTDEEGVRAEFLSSLYSRFARLNRPVLRNRSGVHERRRRKHAACRAAEVRSNVFLSRFSEDTELCAPRKCVTPQQEVAGFDFDRKNVRVREKHFDATDIVKAYEHARKGDAASRSCEGAKLPPLAVPRTFEGLPVHLTKNEV